jgi:hypothetical protein
MIKTRHTSFFKRLSDFGRFTLRHRRIGATPARKPALFWTETPL